MTRTKTTLLLALLTLGLAAPTALAARSFPGMSAIPSNPADASCFSDHSYGYTRNTCSTDRWVMLPVIVDAAAYYNVSVNGSTPAWGAPVACYGNSFDAGGYPWASNWGPYYLAATGTPQSAGVPNLPVYGQGYDVYVWCRMPPGSVIHSYNW